MRLPSASNVQTVSSPARKSVAIVGGSCREARGAPSDAASTQIEVHIEAPFLSFEPSWSRIGARLQTGRSVATIQSVRLPLQHIPEKERQMAPDRLVATELARIL